MAWTLTHKAATHKVAEKAGKVRLSRRRALQALMAAGFVAGVSRLRPVHAEEMKKGEKADALVVVELFTSQGCSACPPADALLRELARQPGILGLTYNVDYWDYLGWRDTLASPEFSRRQRRYARFRKDTKVFTPQMIINGRHSVIGNRREEVLRLIAEEREHGDCRQVPLSLMQNDDMLEVFLGDKPKKLDISEATLWIVMFKAEERVEVTRGENRGKVLHYANVVRSIMPAGMWHGKALTLPLPAEELMVEGADRCAALLQSDANGAIIGAADIDMS